MEMECGWRLWRDEWSLYIDF